MKKHVIPAGDFFTHSPEIHIRRNPAVEDAVREAVAWIEHQPEKGGQMNCQLRQTSNEERDGHLTRLIGVMKMHAMLLDLKGKTDCWLIYHKTVSTCLYRYLEAQDSLICNYCRKSCGVLRITSIHAACLHSTISGGCLAGMSVIFADMAQREGWRKAVFPRLLRKGVGTSFQHEVSLTINVLEIID